MAVIKKPQRHSPSVRRGSPASSPIPRAAMSLAKYAYDSGSSPTVSSTTATRRVAVCVLITKKPSVPNDVLTPPSSPPSSQEYMTRATALQQGLDVSRSQASRETATNSHQDNHAWSFAERQALCLLARVYSNNMRDIAKLLNAMFPCSTSPFAYGMCLAQYTFYRTGHGPPEVRAAYASVWKWTFDDLSTLFAFRIARAEVEAAALGIELILRTADKPFDLKAAKRNQRRERALFRSIQLDEFCADREGTPLSLMGDPEPQVKLERVSMPQDLSIKSKISVTEKSCTPYFTPPSSPGPGIASADTQSCAVQSDELQTSLSKFTLPIRLSAQPTKLHVSDLEHPKLPTLLWRCVGPGTAGLSEASLVVSGRHKPFAGRSLHVCSDPETILDDAEGHISRHETFSPLISTTQSLAWAIMKGYHTAGDSDDKFLYTIDANLAHARTKVFAGHRLAKELRARGRLQAENIISAEDNTVKLTTCVYRGAYDLLVYGEISGPAVMSRISFLELEELAKSCPHVNDFLRLHLFKPPMKLKWIFQKMQRHPVELDRTVGIAIAKLMVCFGVDHEADASIIRSFFETFLQNWQIKVKSKDDSRAAVQVFLRRFIADEVTEERRSEIMACVEEAIEKRKNVRVKWYR